MEDSDGVHKYLSAFIISVLPLGAVSGYVDHRMERKRVERQWQARVDAANANQSDDLQRHFRRWAETVVLRDGTVEQWSGGSSEVLFIERSSQCTLHEDRYWMPCWTIWARTRETHRYFTVLVRIDVDDGARLVSKERHSDVDVHHVIERALSLGKEDAVKKVGVARTKA